MNNQNLKPYPAYKPSGIPWLGDIPAHWEVKPLFAVLSERQVSNKAGNESNVLSLSYGKIVKRDVESNFGLLPESFNTYQIVDPGNIILRLTDLQNDKRSLRTGLVQERGIITSAYVCLAVKKDDCPEYFEKLLHSYDITKVFYTFGAGIRQTMKFEDLKRMPVLLPPLPEQQAIAAYLDGETTRLDALAARYRRLLALLDEKRRTLITHAVTRGLNPTVPLKPSGIPWLGDIPAHWIFDRAKFIFRKMSRPTREEDDVVTAFRDGTVTLRSNRRTEGFTFSIKEIGYQGVRKGDLVIHQMDGFAGAIGVSDSDGKCTPIYSICTPIIPAITHYYGYLLRHMAKSDFILSLAKGIRERSSDFRFDVFRELVLPIPPLPEQQAIAAYLDQETTRLDGLKTKIETLLARLAEYRAALISAAVTGKMDVRDAAFETIQ